MNDLADAVLECAFPIEVTRWLAASVVDGRKQDKLPCKVFTIMASVQPMGQKELQRLPEGTRAEGAVSVYAVEPLQTVRTSEAKQADNFLYNGVTYQVQSMDDWFDLGGYFLMAATRVDR